MPQRRPFKILFLLGLSSVASNSSTDPSASAMASPANTHDCKFLIETPVQGATYSWATARFLAASVDVSFGSGPVSDAVRLEPHAYEVCMEWSPDLWPFRPDSCRPLVPPDGLASEVGTYFECVLSPWERTAPSRDVYQQSLP